MFQTLSQTLSRITQKITHRGRLKEKDILDALREVRVALISADVALPIAKKIVNQVKEQALTEKVFESLTPGQTFIKLLKTELTTLMGSEHAALDLKAQPPVILMMLGLQGTGKTTTAAKIANHLKTEGKKVYLASLDVQRPAAMEQLQTLAQSIDCPAHPIDLKEKKPIKIAKAAYKAAKKSLQDVLILDTAGRLHIDDELMKELSALEKEFKPQETLLTIDSMAGQDALNMAQTFSETLSITGLVLTKVDGDARGGAVLTACEVTQKPVKFLGTSEKIDGLEAFHPDRMASRILGMGDVLSLIEDVESKADLQKTKVLAKKLKKGKSFDLEDFRQQLKQMSQMGGFTQLLGKLPGMGKVPQAAKDQSEAQFKRFEAMINSMTPQERKFPAIIKASRKKRIARGSGHEIFDVNQLLKQFLQMQKMMKKMGKGGDLLRKMTGMLGQ